MNQSGIFALPTDILALVANFLLPENEQNKRIFKYSFDWRKFMNTNKEHLKEWKRRSNLIALTQVYSQKYRKISVFREIISQVIINPLEQLELKYDLNRSRISLAGVDRVKKLEIRTGTLEDYQLHLDELILVGCTLNQLKFILRECRSLPKLDISCSHEFENCSLDVAKDIPIPLLRSLREVSLDQVTVENYSQGFSHLESLSLYNVHSSLEVSCFRNIRRLQFYNCPGITDVSSLGNVAELQLSRCQGVRDVSSLGRVSHLDLSYCFHINDVSALGNVPYLNLDYCHSVTDVSALKNVYELHLEGFKGEKLIGLENVVKLFLNNSRYVTDLSPLRNVQQLRILNCVQLSYFKSLEEYGNITEMSLGQKRNPFNPLLFTVNSGMEVFKKLNKLELYHAGICERTELSEISSLSWNDLTNIRELIFHQCDLMIIPPQSLNHLQSLKFCRCCFINHLPVFPSSLGTLIIEQCDVTEITLSGTCSVSRVVLEFPLYLVEILDCPLLKRIEVSRNISRFHLRKCKKLENLIIQKQVGFLQVEECSKFRTTMGNPSQLVYSSIKLQ
jgi:hypothetical protein